MKDERGGYMDIRQENTTLDNARPKTNSNEMWQDEETQDQQLEEMGAVGKWRLACLGIYNAKAMEKAAGREPGTG